MRKEISSHSNDRRVVRSILLIFASISLCSIFFTYIGLSVQSSVRAYVAGESLWSKSQRDAAYNLHLYSTTGNIMFFEQFEKSLIVPKGLKTARLELLKENYDYETAQKGLIAGGTAIDDVDGVIRLFRCCHRYQHFEAAVKNWEVGDRYIDELELLGRQIHRLLQSATPDGQDLKQHAERIGAISQQVRPFENAFTDALGRAAREVTRLLFLTTCTVIGVLISAGIYLSLRIARSARYTEEQYRLLFDSASDAVFVVDRQSRKVIEVNDKALALTGKPSQALFRSSFEEVFFLPAGTEPTVGIGLRLDLLDERGQHIPVEINGNYTEWHGKPAYLAIVRDISERIKSENTLRVVANAMAHMAEGVVITGTDGNVISINAAFTSITGFNSEAILNKPVMELLLRREGQQHTKRALRKVRHSGTWKGEVQGFRQDGDPLVLDLSISAVQNEKGDIDNYVAVLNDVTLSKGYQKQLVHLANHDALTQLPNRAAFNNRCKALLEAKSSTHGSLALLFIDLDGFKLINDTFGHAAGDHVLKVVAERISNCLKSYDFVARLGGDEFVVLLPNDLDEKTVSGIALRILASLASRTNYQGNDLTVLASIGISRYPADGRSPETLLTKADTAMYEAKHKGRNNFQFYESRMTVDAGSRLQLLTALREAAEKDQFELLYQPAIDLRTGKTVGLEALIRWNHPQLGLVSPDQFIPLAEETGLIGQISDWVVRKACAQICQWQAEGVPVVPVALNISPVNFWDPTLPKKIGQILTETGCLAQMICLEITENAMMNRLKSIEMIRELSGLGLKIAIDDFGMGYSSLSYLKDFTVNLRVGRDSGRICGNPL